MSGQIYSLKKRINETREQSMKLSGKKDTLSTNLIQRKNKLATIDIDQKNTIIARDLLEKASLSAREKGKTVLEKSATNIVQMVFGNQYQIKIELDVKAGSPIANVLVEKKISNNFELINIENEGGGLRDIISLSFFIAVSQLVGKENGALITLDEPTPAVSVGHAEATAEAISVLMEYANKQSLIITHEREFLPNLIDHVYYVEQSADGVSKTVEL